MLFSQILGHGNIKKYLAKSVDNKRIPHAQLFVGSDGCGVLSMAIAYAQYVLCNKTGVENVQDTTVCNLKFEQLTHPDLHFAFPVATTSKIKTHPVSKNFLPEWRNFIKEQPYGNLYDWYRVLDIENKQGQIGVDEAQEIIKTLSLKSFEGGHKAMIIWMAEKMNAACANKLLKLIEEPPEKTFFILIVEDETQIIQTIKSRCQVLHFNPLADVDIAHALKQQGLTEQEALKITYKAQGNYNKALEYMNQNSEDFVFEKWFVTWVRSAFKAKGNKTVINELLSWSDELSGVGRETQKKFLSFCIDVFRQALLINYNANALKVTSFSSEKFALQKFAPFIHGNNILAIYKALEEAIYHIERNGNAKIIFTDLSIKLTRLLHVKTMN